MPPSILMTGGTGLVGNILLSHFLKKGYRVTILTRQPIPRLVYFNPLLQYATLIQYNPTRPGTWQDAIADNNVIINLAGASIFRYWTPLAKAEISKSRLTVTSRLVEALAFRENTGRSLLSISGTGYYGDRGEAVLSEQEPAGRDFLARLAEKWESLAMAAAKFKARVVICRIGNVLSLKGGMLPRLITLAKINLGCRWGSGRQWMSWIHEEDLAEAFSFLIENTGVNGPVNITSPEPVRNSEMMRQVCRYVQQAPFLPGLPAWMLKIAAGELASVFLSSQRAIPLKLQASGFSFRYPTIKEALKSLS